MKNNKKLAYSLEGQDPSYFLHYAGTRKPYDKIWREHSYVDEVIEQFKAPGAPRVKKILVLGVATGKIIPFLQRAFASTVYGCEINAWAFNKIPQRYRRHMTLQDMSAYLSLMRERGRVFDLSFSNSLVYLERKVLKKTLCDLAFCTRILSFNCSFRGRACPDQYRKILENYEWWNRRLCEAGFKELRAQNGGRTYLWESSKI